MEAEKITQIRKRVKSAAADLQQRAKNSPDILKDMGRAFLGGISRYKEREFQDPLYTGMPGMPEMEYRRREFLYGFAAVRMLLGHRGNPADAPYVNDSYIRDVKKIEGDIPLKSIGNCAIVFLRDGLSFEYAPGTPARGYTAIGRIFTSDKFLAGLDEECAGEAFFKCVRDACSRRRK